MQSAKRNTMWGIKWSISLLACLALVVRIAFPQLKIDAVSLGLLALAVLPWLSPLVKSAEFPGAFKIEFQDVQTAVEKISLPAAADPPGPAAEATYSYMSVVSTNPDLALVGLRIEIEKRLRQLARLTDTKSSVALPRIVSELRSYGILDQTTAGGLNDLISLGNQAAHGATVSPEAAQFAAHWGARVLEALDAKLNARATNG